MKKKEYLTERVRVRLTPREKEWLIAQAAQAEGTRQHKKDGAPILSDYLRKIVLRESGYRDEATVKLLRDLVYQINKIGVNVNQVAHQINSGFGSPEDIAVLAEELSKINAAVSDVKEEVRSHWHLQS